MAGLYLHIPFCRQACVYCDFHFSTSLKRKNDMLAAICREIALRKDFFEKSSLIQSIYLGGGTPSVLKKEELSYIFSHLHRHFNCSPTAEITLEANPEDLSAQYLEEIYELGINRLSIGIQSFSDQTLKWMNRPHTAQEAIKAVKLAQEIGIENISVDLIFGSPQLSLEAWKTDLEKALELKVPHFSLYALTVEPKTLLAHQVKTGHTSLPLDHQFAEQFLFADEFLSDRGYDHYELSNYALPPHYSQHNSSYWQQIPYLGLGPSAHSFNGHERMWNIANNSRYIQKLMAGEAAIEEREQLNKKDRYHEYVMTGLRQKRGIDLAYIKQQFELDIDARFAQLLKQWEQEAYMQHEGNSYFLTPRGWLISDRLISELFV